MSFSLIACVSCHKGSHLDIDQNQDVDMMFPYASYIYFNTVSSTKGETLYDNLIGKDFAVTAYKYDGTWGIVSKGECKPNLLWNLPVVYDANSGTHKYDARDKDANVLAELVTDRNGNELPLLPWEDNTNYAFYAHYPHVADNSSLLSLSSKNFDGEPYLDFTLPGNVDDMIDLMTAYAKDENNSIDNYVTLRMYHRLSCFDVFVSNEIQNISDKVVSVQIENLSVTFKNLMYQKASFWIDRTYKQNSEAVAGIRNLTPFSTNGTEKTYLGLIIEPVMIEKGNRQNITKINNKSLLVIPQKTDNSGKYLSGYLSFTCKFVDQNGNPVQVPLLQDDNSTIQVTELNNQVMPFNVNKNIDANNMYYLELAFINGVITLRVQSAPSWEDDVDVDFEFN